MAPRTIKQEERRLAREQAKLAKARETQAKREAQATSRVEARLAKLREKHARELAKLTAKHEREAKALCKGSRTATGAR